MINRVISRSYVGTVRSIVGKLSHGFYISMIKILTFRQVDHLNPSGIDLGNVKPSLST